MEPGPSPLDDHPSPEDLASYVTRTADPVTRAVVESHVLACVECAADVRELEVEDAEILEALNQTPASSAGAGRGTRTTLLVAILVVAALVALWLIGGRAGH